MKILFFFLPASQLLTFAMSAHLSFLIISFSFLEGPLICYRIILLSKPGIFYPFNIRKWYCRWIYVYVCAFSTMEMKISVNNVENFYGYGWFLFHHSINLLGLVVCFATNTHKHTWIHSTMYKRDNISCASACMSTNEHCYECSNCILHVLPTIWFLFFSTDSVFVAMMLLILVSFSSQIHIRTYARTYIRTKIVSGYGWAQYYIYWKYPLTFYFVHSARA